MMIIAMEKIVTMNKVIKLFLVSIIYYSNSTAIDTSTSACWQRKYGYSNQIEREYQRYYNRSHAPYPYYRGAFIP